jgi:zinc-binding alcohol dehydrogenase family protein
MKAIGFYKNYPIDHPEALLDLELETPEIGEYDILVEVKAVSVNPVDTKIRAGGTILPNHPRIAGWDAAGIVRETGAKTTGFKVGDRVWYAGDITRQGSNAERQAVDERIVGLMPKSLNFAQAASLPLTAITAWELLFDRLAAHATDPIQHNVLLITGAAGGVGSILIQLARRLTGLTVIGTASRKETRDWAIQLGAHYVIDHNEPWLPQLTALGISEVSHVIGLHNSASYTAQIAEVLRPEGQFALIDDPKQLDIAPFKSKSISIHWELMYTRPIYKTPTLARQQGLLNRLAALVDAGDIKHTMTKHISGLNASTLREAHRLVEAGNMMGKVVLTRE